MDRDLFATVSAAAAIGLRVASWVVPIGTFIAAPFAARAEPGTEWGLDAFSAMGTFAGFMLAALALVLAAQPSRALASLDDTPAFDGLLMAMVWSTAAWLAAAFLGLLAWLADPAGIWRWFVAVTAWGVVEQLHAGFLIYATVRRFFSTFGRSQP